MSKSEVSPQKDENAATLLPVIDQPIGEFSRFHITHHPQNMGETKFETEAYMSEFKQTMIAELDPKVVSHYLYQKALIEN